MPRPPQVQSGPDGQPKRRRVTAVIVFIRDLKQSRSDLRNLPMSSMELIRVGNEEFERLSLEERHRYEQIAKAENRVYDENFGVQFRRDCDGIYLSDRDAAVSIGQEFERYTTDLVAELVGRVSSLEKVALAEFVVGEVFEFVDADERLDKGVYVPAEFGFVRFSLKAGVTGRLHCIVHPRLKAIPTELTSQARANSADTHLIPMQGCEFAEESMTRLCIGLKSLCARGDTSGQWQLPIFVPEEHLTAMQKALKYAFDDPTVRHEGCPFVKEINRANKTKVFPFEKLYVAVLNSQCLPPASRRPGLLVGEVTRELIREGFTGEEHGCKFHLAKDNLRYCALLRAHSYAWALLRSAAEPYGLEQTANHRPPPLEVKLPRPCKANWLTQGSRHVSCPGNLSAAAGGGGWRQTLQMQRRPPQPPPRQSWRVAGSSASAASGAGTAEFDDGSDQELDLDRLSLSGGFAPSPKPPSRPPIMPHSQSYSGAVGGNEGGGDGGYGVGRGRGRPIGSGRGPIIID